MTAADDRRAARQAAQRARAERGAPLPGVTAERSTPIRITVDLQPPVYRQFTGWAVELAEAIGRARVSHADVVRALVHVISDDRPDHAEAREATRSAILAALKAVAD